MNSPERVNKLALFMWVIGVLSYAVAVINRSSFASLGPTAQDHFAVDATILGSFAVMQLVLYTAMQIPVGIFVQRFGPTRVILSGAVLMVGGQTLLALADSVWLVILARILVGIGDSCTFVSVLRLQGHWFPLRQLPIWTQVTSQVGQAGQIVSIVPLAFIVATAGWTAGFLTIAAITGALALFSFVFLRDSPMRRSLLAQTFRRDAQHTTDTGTIRTSSFFGDLSVQLRTLPKLLRIPGVRLGFWLHFTAPFSAGVFIMLWGYPFLTGGAGLSRGTAATLVSMSVLASIVIGLLLGPLSARFHNRRVQMVVGVVILIIAVWTMVLLWPGEPPVWMLVILMLVIAAGSPMSMIGFDVLRDHAPPKQISLATGFVNTGGFISVIVTLFLIGLVLDLQDAGTPETYATLPFKFAMCAQYVCWLVGLAFIARENRLVRRAQSTPAEVSV